MSSERGWMEGVPLELRPRYYPKPPLRFKDIDIYIPLDAIENDYDFTEERRVLTECKMWEEDKEKERLAEEERIRLKAEEDERIRLEEERKEIERLEKEASLDETTNSSDQETTLVTEVNDKLTITDNLDNSHDEQEHTVSVPNHYVNSGNSSKQNSHHESPTSEETSISHPQSVLPTPEPEAIVTVPLTSIHHQAINGYHYMMGSEIPMPMYHSTVPHYYNYYVPPPSVTAPIVSMPLQITQQQHQLQQSAGAIIQQTQPHQPQNQASSAPVPPVLHYQSVPVSSQLSGSHHAVAGPVYQTHPAPAAPPSSQASAQTPIQTQSTTVSATASSCDSGTSSPVVCEKQPPSKQLVLNQKSQSQPDLSKSAVELKDLSDFESDMTNPFDNVELKSINDMEMLASVLKHHVPTSQGGHSATTSAATNPQSTSAASTGSTYVNGSGYYRQPTPAYPPVTSQCPYPPGPSWNMQNGYFPPPTVPVSNSNHGVSNSIAPPQSQQNSHIPSPTQAIEQQQSQQRQTSNAEADSSSADNSFTKLHFPFLTSMAASSRSTRDRDNTLGYLSSSFNRPYLPQSGTTPPQHPSADDIATQNPFLSSYVQSHNRNQYWPTSHMSHPAPHHQHQNPYSAHANVTPVQNGPAQSTIGSNFIATSAPPTAPPTGSQHALR